MRKFRTLMLGLLMSALVSVTPGFGSSPPVSVPKITKVHIEPDIISAIPGQIYQAVTPVGTNKITSIAVDDAIDQRMQPSAATITSGKISDGLRADYKLHIDPGLKNGEDLTTTYNI